MLRCQADSSIERRDVDGFKFPMGVYPVETMHPRAGYAIQFEPADGGQSEGEWEEWPDRYVLDIVISADRLEALVLMLMDLLPMRVYPILDVMGHDAFREIDPYISYELVGLDRVQGALQRCRDFFFEDGLCGFGAMCDDPFIYLFVDEHKIVTMRVSPEMRERVERVLKAFDLEPTDEPAGADAAAHEHRTVLLAPDDKPELMSVEEIVEQLRDEWHLTLNVDPESNLDEEGRELGVTWWRCLVRFVPKSGEAPVYTEVVLTAGNYLSCEELAIEAGARQLEIDPMEVEDVLVVSADRMRHEQAVELLGRTPDASPVEVPGADGDLGPNVVYRARRLG